MIKGIFITGTATDIGKTYVTALLVKKLREIHWNAGYYKAALSGSETISQSDAGYVNRTANIKEQENMLLSYLYKNSVSPHLAAKLEGNPVDLNKVQADFFHASNTYSPLIVEGSGGIVCPIRWDETYHILLEDIIKMLHLDTIIVADAGLGTINAVVVTVEYLKARNIGIRGIILNHFTGGIVEEDNIKMIEEITNIPIIALVKPNETELAIKRETLNKIFEEE